MGCDPSTFYSHKWAFSIVDKCIILEDDLVVSQSFFPFCKELLDRYAKEYAIPVRYEKESLERKYRLIEADLLDLAHGMTRHNPYAVGDVIRRIWEEM